MILLAPSTVSQRTLTQFAKLYELQLLACRTTNGVVNSIVMDRFRAIQTHTLIASLTEASAAATPSFWRSDDAGFLPMAALA